MKTHKAKKSKSRTTTSLHDVLIPFERISRILRSAEHSHDLNPAQWEVLRYLAQANRFSNAPMSLTRYLDSTKGTVSQTVKALERKGLLVKSTREGQKRSVSLNLTEAGHACLQKDPQFKLDEPLALIDEKVKRRLNKGLKTLLASLILEGQLLPFGTCQTCRYFREHGREGDAQGPHLCMFFNAPLRPQETNLMCQEQQPRA